MSSNNNKLDPEIKNWLRDPADGSYFKRIEGDSLLFSGGNSYPLFHGTPILIDEHDSLFKIDDIMSNLPTTQSPGYRNRNYLKNYVRQKILPTLSADRSFNERYNRLAENVAGGPVLIVGVGDKIDYFSRCFSKSKVVTADVHCQFGADIVFDAHKIPFQEESFALVLAGQVLEHTVRPWIVAQEFQRVVKNGGYIQIEVPFAFPYHGAPYDFYRFTPSALRFLFSQCVLETLEVPEGTWSAAATVMSQALIDSFKNRLLRMMAVAAGRIFLWWIKYLDNLVKPTFNIPKGYAATYRFDGQSREQQQLLEDVQRTTCASMRIEKK